MMKVITAHQVVKEQLHVRYLELARDSGILKNPNAKSLTAVYEKSDGWYIGSIRGVPGALTQGRSLNEARINIIDALRLLSSKYKKTKKKLKYIDGLWNSDIPCRNSYSITSINFKDRKKARHAARLMNGWLERYFNSERKAKARWLEIYDKSDFVSNVEYLYHAEFRKRADGKTKMIFRKKYLTPQEKKRFNKTMTDYIRQQLPNPSKKKFRYLLGIWGPSVSGSDYQVIETISIPTKKRARNIAVMLDALLRDHLDDKYLTRRRNKHER